MNNDSVTCTDRGCCEEKAVSMTTEYHTGPVTALCTIDNLILAGIGSRVVVYSVRSWKCLTSTQILPARVIHGIKLDPWRRKTSEVRLCVFGGQCFRIVTMDSISGQLVLESGVQQLTDWIWTVTWLQDCPCLGVALAHNVMLIWDYTCGHIVEDHHCEEKCILYTATFLTHVKEALILAAGTVFNQVVIWGPKGTVYHRLTGHQGVIFSVAYDADSRTICSVSDDRSIRLWKLKFSSDNSPPTHSDWASMDSSIVHVLYGHSARVWDVQLLTNVLVSIGEDSTCCMWGYDGKVKQKFKGHKGKSIWSLSVSDDEKYVVTGGGDNSIRLWYLEQENDTETDTSTALDLKLNNSDFPRIVQLQDFNNVLIMTNEGVLWQHNLQGNQWTQLMSDGEFRSYTVLAVSPDGQCVCVGNIHGTVRLIKFTEMVETGIKQPGYILVHDVQVYDGKVLSLRWLSRSHLLTSGPAGHMKLLTVKHEAEVISTEKTVTFALPHSRQCWVAAATVTPNWYSVICGDRSGSVYVYNWQEGNQTAELDQRFVKIHGKAGVTDISFHDNQVYTSGRDGLYRIYNWSEDTRKLELLNSNRVFKGMEWIERLHFTDGGCLIYGFHANQFVVWSVEQNQKLLQVSCGGGHRAWDFKVNSGHHGNQARLVYLKQREVILQDSQLNSCQRIVKGSLHGRELCDVKHLQSFVPTPDETVEVVVTCSEDTTICFSAIHFSRGGATQLYVLKTLQEHISSVRHLAICNSSLSTQNSCRQLIFSGGGRAQIKVWRVEFSVCPVPKIETTDSSKTDQISGIDCKVESVCGIQLGMQDGPRRHKHWRHIQENSDPETRFLALTVFNTNQVCHDGSQHFFLSAACSDGFVRFYGFNENSRDLTALGLSGFHDHCVLKVFHVIHKSSRRTSAVILSGATDGRIAFWDVTELVQRFSMNSKKYAPKSQHQETVATDLHMEESVSTVPTQPIKAETERTQSVSVSGSGKDVSFCSVKQNDAKDSSTVPVATCTTNEADNNIMFDMTTTLNSFKDNEENISAIGPKSACPDEKLESEITPVFVMTCHQSGVNSLHLAPYSENSYILATGGDDNAVQVSIISIATIESSLTEVTKDHIEIKVICEGGNLSAHSAQISGVWCLSSDKVLTASIDQRVCVWRVSLTPQGQLLLALIGCQMTSVADVANIDVWNVRGTQILAVCGEGLELLSLKNINS